MDLRFFSSTKWIRKRRERRRERESERESDRMAPKGKGLAAEGGERKTCLGILFAHYVRQQTKDKKTQVFAQGPKCYGVSWEVKKKKK